MFDNRFQVFLADTELSQRLHFQIRYRVFCIDQGFEDRKAPGLGEEKDHWDEQSLHFLVREKSTGQWVATMRAILPKAKPFPVESLCNYIFSDDLTYKRDASCEISRLCIVKRYRGRQGLSDPHREVSGCNTGDQRIGECLLRRQEPEIMLGLFRAALGYSLNHKVKHWYFLISPSLARIIKRIGVTLQKIGPEIEHKGTRAPYVTDPVASCRASMKQSPLIAKMFSKDIPAYQLFSELWPEKKNVA